MFEDWQNQAAAAQMEEALNKVFSDTRVSQAVTADMLRDVINECQTMIESMGE